MSRHPSRHTLPTLALVALAALSGCTTTIDGPAPSDSDEEQEAWTPPDHPTTEPAEQCSYPTWPGDAVVEVGTGQDCFTAVAEDDTVPLIFGPQGGYHIWLGLRCRGCGGYESVTYGVRDAETHEPLGAAGAQSSVVELDEVDGVSFGAGLTAYVGEGYDDFDGDGGADWVGRDVILWAEVELGPEIHTSEVRIRVGGIEHQQSNCPDCN